MATATVEDLEKAVADARAEIEKLSSTVRTQADQLNVSLADGRRKDKNFAALMRLLNGGRVVKTGLSFFSSGVFFMIVGALMLLAAYQTMGGTHTSFTFVLVVVGVAVLLYGTGTQTAGQFDTSAASTKYKVAIAGGAGLLAFLVAYGIVDKDEEIKNAFQIEKSYFRYVLMPDEDGVSDLGNYAAIAEVNGERVPALTRTNFIEIYVPYFPSQDAATITGIVKLHRITEVKTQVASKDVAFQIQIKPQESIAVSDGGYDFPRFKGDAMRVSVMEARAASSSSRDADVFKGQRLPPEQTIGLF